MNSNSSISSKMVVAGGFVTPETSEHLPIIEIPASKLNSVSKIYENQSETQSGTNPSSINKCLTAEKNQNVRLMQKSRLLRKRMPT
jgi:hypothetical protein